MTKRFYYWALNAPLSAQFCGTWLGFVEASEHTFFNTGLFISPSGTSELDCATTKKDRAERSISIGRESLKVFFFFVLGALAYLQVLPLGGSRDEEWRAQ